MQYKCIKNWARNRVGDIIEDWELKRYPSEVHDNFVKLQTGTLDGAKKANPLKSPAPVFLNKLETTPKETQVEPVVKKNSGDGI